MIFKMTQVTSIMAKMAFKQMHYQPTWLTEWHIEAWNVTKHTTCGNIAWVLREHFNTFYHVSWLPRFLTTLLWTFFQKDFMKLDWVTSNMTWMIFKMTQVTSIIAKMAFKQMRYQLTNQPTDQPTDGSTKWHTELRNATKKIKYVEISARLCGLGSRVALWPVSMHSKRGSSFKRKQVSNLWHVDSRFNKAGYTAIRCVLAWTDSSFGQKRHFHVVSTRVWRTDGRTDRRTDGHTLL